MTQIEQALRDAGHAPVLFVSSEDGDEFIFGTQEELENEEEALSWTDGSCELSTAFEFLNKLDFGVYEGNEPVVTR